MKQETIRISESEWEIMRAVWEGEPVAAADIVETLADSRDWKPRTVRTMIDRLLAKGALRAEKDGKRFLYSAALRQDELVREESRSFMVRVFGGQPASMLARLVDEAELSAEEIKELRRVLNRKSK